MVERLRGAVVTNLEGFRGGECVEALTVPDGASARGLRRLLPGSSSLKRCTRAV